MHAWLKMNDNQLQLTLEFEYVCWVTVVSADWRTGLGMPVYYEWSFLIKINSVYFYVYAFVARNAN